MYIEVRGKGDAADVAKALRLFSKMVKKEGLIEEIYSRQEYVKPSRKKKLKENEARRRKIWDEKKLRRNPESF